MRPLFIGSDTPTNKKYYYKGRFLVVDEESPGHFVCYDTSPDGLVGVEVGRGASPEESLDCAVGLLAKISRQPQDVSNKR